VVGNAAPEPLGDREGHAISVEQDSCRISSGPLAGAVISGTEYWEWDKTSAVLLSGGGIERKPGATSAFQLTDGKLDLIMSDGKVTGVVGSGHGRWTLATGDAASMAGKSYSWSSKLTGPNQFEVEIKGQ
jgi:hypothetical protein